MRRLLAFLLVLLAAASAPAAPPRDWTQAVRAAPAGGYLIGNPAARVKLVEYVSYTCPHCRHFSEASAAVLMGRMVRSGSTSVEIRNQVHDKVDFTAVILARCVGAGRFLRYHDAVYAGQDAWFAKAAVYDQSGAAAALSSNNARAKAFADASGLSAIALRAGLTQPELSRCFAGDTVIAAVAKSAAAIREDVTGTPAFEINGQLVRGANWAELEPQLRAAGAK